MVSVWSLCVLKVDWGLLWGCGGGMGEANRSWLFPFDWLLGKLFAFVFHLVDLWVENVACSSVWPSVVSFVTIIVSDHFGLSFFCHNIGWRQWCDVKIISPTSLYLAVESWTQGKKCQSYSGRRYREDAPTIKSVWLWCESISLRAELGAFHLEGWSLSLYNWCGWRFFLSRDKGVSSNLGQGWSLEELSSVFYSGAWLVLTRCWWCVCN